MSTIRHLVYRFFSFLVLLTLCFFNNAFFGSISLILKSAPPKVIESLENTLQQEGVINQSLEKLATKTPTSIGKKLLKNGFKTLLPKVSGFIALYGGYVDYSDHEGQVSFPVLHKEPKMYLVITNDIMLLNIHGNTISHRELVKEVPAKIYLIERKEDEDKQIYWQVTEKTVPQNNRISPLSLVLLTKPKNIVVPTGDFITTENTNLVLPEIYVVGNIDQAKTLLDFLDISKYFEPIRREEKQEKEVIVQKLMENI